MGTLYFPYATQRSAGGFQDLVTYIQISPVPWPVKIQSLSTFLWTPGGLHLPSPSCLPGLHLPCPLCQLVWRSTSCLADILSCRRVSEAHGNCRVLGVPTSSDLVQPLPLDDVGSIQFCLPCAETSPVRDRQHKVTFICPGTGSGRWLYLQGGGTDFPTILAACI